MGRLTEAMVSGTSLGNMRPIATAIVSNQRALKVDVVRTAPVGAGDVSGLVFGDVTLQVVTSSVAVRRTGYTQQTSSFRRSLVSSSSLDAVLGAGAQQVRLRFFDDLGRGPFDEVVSMNGTSSVSTVSSDVCFIESIEVTRVGAAGNNDGLISLYQAPGKSGSVFATLPRAEKRTFWAHHYVASGSVCNITGLSCGSSAAVANNGSTFYLKAVALASGAVESQVSDTQTLYGQSSQIVREYGSPIVVRGPARVVAYVDTIAGANMTYRAAFDFYDQ